MGDPCEKNNKETNNENDHSQAELGLFYGTGVGLKPTVDSVLMGLGWGSNLQWSESLWDWGGAQTHSSQRPSSFNSS